MQVNFGIEPTPEKVTSIKVIGVGGGGGNAVNRMILSGTKGIEFISMNTDAQVLSTSHATYKLAIGSRLTKGQGAGGDSSVGQRAAEESRDEIAAMLKGTDMVFITAGMGGGTGTGAAPVVAEIAHDMGILTVAVVTKPFKFEGKRRIENAENGIMALRENIDSLLIIPNDRLRQISSEPITLKNAFAMADNVLQQGVQSISELICNAGFINLDFADITRVMKNSGIAHMGVGRGSGKDKVRLACEGAVHSPLLETSIEGAKRVIVNITAPSDILLEDAADASEMVTQAAHPDVDLIWGVAYDDNLKDEMIVTVIATGFDENTKYTDAAKEMAKNIGNYTFKSTNEKASDVMQHAAAGAQNMQQNVQQNAYGAYNPNPAATVRNASNAYAAQPAAAPQYVPDTRENSAPAQEVFSEEYGSKMADEKTSYKTLMDIFNRKDNSRNGNKLF